LARGPTPFHRLLPIQLVASQISKSVMDIPHRGARPVALPEIYVHDPKPTDRFRTSSSSSSFNSTSSPLAASIPMSIPNSRDPVPPPLPPPRHLKDLADNGNNGQDIAWQWGNSPANSDWGRSIASVQPGSSLCGSFASRMDERPDISRRGSSTSTIKSMSGTESQEHTYPRIDEGYASLSGTSIGSTKSVLPIS
jgi:hypothetical protein